MARGQFSAASNTIKEWLTLRVCGWRSAQLFRARLFSNATGNSSELASPKVQWRSGLPNEPLLWFDFPLSITLHSPQL